MLKIIALYYVFRHKTAIKDPWNRRILLTDVIRTEGH